MKKIYSILSIFLLSSIPAFAKIRVITTLPVFESLAQEVGGEKIDTASIARGNQDPHFLDAKPSYVVQLSQADLLIHGGLDLEKGWLPPLLLQARNPKIQAGGDGDVNAAQGLTILETGNADRSQGDVHPNGNPHTWLDPENAKTIAANIFRHLQKIDVSNAVYYRKRLDSFIARISAKSNQWKKSLSSLKNRKIITYHRSLSYFANWADITVIATIEPKPGIPPNPKHIENLLRIITTENIKLILIEEFYPHKVPDYLADKTGIKHVIITNTTGSQGISTYEQLIDQFVGVLTANL